MPEKKEKDKKKCFVIMPFTVKEIDQLKYKDPNHWTEVYEGLIVPAVENAGLDCHREDDDIRSRAILESILNKIENADLILGDLSSHNPNVFLELGWALRADKPFVLIKDELTSYNFDLSQRATFNYCHTLQPTALRKEIKSLQEMISNTLVDKERLYSLVKQMSLSVSSIETIRGDDLNAKLLVDIHEMLGEIKNNTSGDHMRKDKDKESEERVRNILKYFSTNLIDKDKHIFIHPSPIPK